MRLTRRQLRRALLEYSFGDSDVERINSTIMLASEAGSVAEGIQALSRLTISLPTTPQCLRGFVESGFTPTVMEVGKSDGNIPGMLKQQNIDNYWSSSICF